MRALALVVLLTAASARADEVLRPVVVAAVDLAAGDVVTLEKVTQRAAPERLITASIINPDTVFYAVNQRLLVPVLAGQVLRWAHLETPAVQDAEVCRRAAREPATAKEQVARARAAVLAGTKKK